jgi:hypothetical protein
MALRIKVEPGNRKAKISPIVNAQAGPNRLRHPPFSVNRLAARKRSKVKRITGTTLLGNRVEFSLE